MNLIAILFNRQPINMSEYYSVIDLSENMSETPEGYLVCKDAAIAMSGDLKYRPYETGIESSTGVTIIRRDTEELFNEKTMTSFEGKPITIGHPGDGTEFVGPDNWKDLSVGTIQNVRQGEGMDADKLIADLIITDFEAIQAVKERKLRQLSIGYSANFKETEKGKGKQTDIIGNHAALVEKGRCGSQCAIFDSAPDFNPEIKSMTIRNTLKRTMGMAIDKAIDAEMPDDDDEKKVNAMDEVTGALSKMSKRMDEMQAQFDEYKGSMAGSGEDDRVGKMADLIGKIAASILPVEDEDPDKKEKAADEDKKDDDDKKKTTSDSDTLARAEILAPGISDGEGIKGRSLKEAYKTEEGKEAIDTILSGKAFDSVDSDMLFISAAEVLKAKRMEKANSLKKMTADKADGKIFMDAEDLNKMHKEHYKK